MAGTSSTKRQWSFTLDRKTFFKGKEYSVNPFTTDDACVALDFFLHATDENGKRIPWKELKKGLIEQLTNAAIEQGCFNSMSQSIPQAVITVAVVQPPNPDTAASQGAPELVKPAATFDGPDVAPSIEDLMGIHIPSTWAPPQYEGQSPLGGPLSAPRSNLQILANDPVDLFSGAFYLNDVDMIVPGTIMPLTFERVYRSGAPYLGPFGWGWDHNHNLFLRELADGSVARWNGRLQEQIFTVDGDEFKSPPGVLEGLIKIGDGDYRIEARFGTTVRFTRPEGWTNDYKIPVAEIRDRYGNALVYNYDEQNRVESVVCVPADSPSGIEYHRLVFEYGLCGLLEAVSDSVGRTVYYDHDPDIQHLIRVRFPATSDHPEGTRRIYHYEGLHADQELKHNILRVEDDEGRVFVENEYDADPSSWSYGRVILQRYGGYEYVNRYTQLQVVQAIPELMNELCLRVEVFAPDKGLTTYTFNYQGNLLDRRLRLNRDGSWRVVAWGYTYDAEGNLIQIDEPDGSKELMTYDHENSDPRMRGNLLQREIDSAALFESRVVWIGTYDSTYQLLTSETEAPGDGFTSAELKTIYEYGTVGKLESITYPDVTLPDATTQSAQALFEINDSGQVTASVSPEGIRTEFEYDTSATVAFGRLLAVTQDVGGFELRTEYEYDDYGYALAATGPSGARTDTIRNALGLIERYILPEIDGGRADMRLHYDSDGKMVEIERPRGALEDPMMTGDYIVDRIRRNAVGYPIASEVGVNTSSPREVTHTPDYRGLPEKTIQPDGSIISMLYDERGSLLREEVVGVDRSRNARRVIYDLMGRPIEIISGPKEDVRRINHYDGYGRLARTERVTRQADGSVVGTGATTVNIWNDRGLLARRELREYPGTVGSTILAVEEFEYDQRRRLTKSTARPFTTTFDEITTPKLTTSYFYDRDGRLIKTIDPRDGIATVTYDSAGRVVEQVDPMGNSRTYAYDIDARTVAISHIDNEPDGTPRTRTYTKRFDARGRFVEAVDPDGASTSIEYDDRDLPVALIDKEDVRHERRYGLLGELVAATSDPGGLAITNLWNHDRMGRVVRYEDPTGEITSYSYDGIGRPLSTQYPGGARSLHEYGADGRLRATRLKSGSRLEYTYDSAGRMASFQASGAAGITDVPLHTYQYDQLDRLISASIGASTVSRAYDSLGRLLNETTHGVGLGMAYDDLAGTMTRSWDEGREEELTVDLNGFVTRIERTSSGALGSGPALLGDFLPYGPGMLGQAELMNAAVTSTVAYDERKRQSKIDHSDGTSSIEQAIYRYDLRDRRRVELLESGTVQRRYHRFDNRRRLTNTDEDFTLTIALSSGYYQSEHDSDIDNVEGDSASASINYQFQLDKSDARTLVLKTGASSRAYTYNAGHRIATAGTDAFTHYIDGTRSTDGPNRYEVDALGRVLRISDPTGAVTRNALAYDPLGRVASITDGAGVRRDLSYFGGEIWQESIGGAADRQYSRHSRLPGPAAVHLSGASYLPLHDARMNLLAVTDTSGAVLDRCRYEPFGTPSSATLSTTGLEPVFGGMRYLADSGLYLAGLRLMDPVEGAWLSQDPSAYVDSPNLYSYAAGNPIDFVDPGGAQLSMSGGFHSIPDATNPMGKTTGLPFKADWKINDVVHQNDWLFNPLTDIYKSSQIWAPGIYYGGYAASGALVGGLEVARDPWKYGIVEPVTGLWEIGKASSPLYMAIDPKGALKSQNAIGMGIVNSVAHPEEGSFQAGRGAGHNVLLTLATEGAGSILASRTSQLPKLPQLAEAAESEAPVLLYHGTSSNRAAKVVGNMYYERGGFRPGLDNRVFLAEDMETAKYFGIEGPRAVSGPDPQSFTVIRFEIPRSMAEEFGLMEQHIIGEARGLPIIDPGATPYERILSGENIAKFNQALKQDLITFKRFRY